MGSVANTLLPVILLMLAGYLAYRRGILSESGSRQLSDLTFALLAPALLFRSMARTDFSTLDFAVPLGYFGPAVPIFAGLAIWRIRNQAGFDSAAIFALGGTFSNTFMLGVPLVSLCWGQEGLASLLMVVAMHSLILQTSAIVLIEFGRRHANGAGDPWRVVTQSVKSTLANPVIAPIVLGIFWSLSGFQMPTAIDSALQLAGAAAPALCLLLLGASLGQFGLKEGVRNAWLLTVIKNLLHPAAVYCFSRFVLNLDPLAVAVITLAAALPVGNNVYLLAQRYQAEVPMASALILVSTLFCALSLPILLAWLGA